MSAKKVIIPHGKLRRYTCRGLRSIGTLCPQVYASWKFFLCGRPQYFHMQVHSCPQRGPRMSADINADIFADVYGDVRIDGCGRPHGWVLMSAEVRIDGCGHPAGPKDLLELLPLLCNNLLIICGIT